MRRICGKPRKYTDAQVSAVLAWQPFAQLCESIGMNTKTGRHIRHVRYSHKKPCPGSRK